MAGSAKARAVAALLDAFKASLPVERAALVDTTGRGERFEDNLVPSLSADQIGKLRAQRVSGDGDELDFGPAGERPDAHAAHSSAALACNAFGIWIGREQQPTFNGLGGGLAAPLHVEVKQRIFRGGRHLNLDVLVAGYDVVLGVESKLTEPLARHTARAWSDAYGRDSTRALVSDGWLKALDDARAGAYRPAYLDVDQLLKHALGLAKQHPSRKRHLLYVFWEPTEAGDVPEVIEHRQEVAELLNRVGNASPRLHALSYLELWSQWDAMGLPWLSAHVACLRQRYELAISD